MDLSKLKEPFDANDIEWRLQSCGEKNGKIWGKALAYVTNRAICNRLDEVVGPENWKNEFIKGPDGGILCGLSILINGDWVTKYDGAENTNIEAVKGGLSGAMKRAASTGWGIGRYLYNLEEGWANINEKGKMSEKTKEGKWFNWDPPALPQWALPKGSKPQSTSNISESDKARIEELKNAAIEYEAAGILNNTMMAQIEEAIGKQDLKKLESYLKYAKELSDKKPA